MRTRMALACFGCFTFTVGLASCAAQKPATETDPPGAVVALPEAAPPSMETAPPAHERVARRAPSAPPLAEEPRTLRAQREQLFRTMERELDLSASELGAVKGIIQASAYIGQGNPAVTRHPMTRAECRQIRGDEGLVAEPHAPCARANMVPVYNPEAGETAKDAKVCIDQYEFPNVACEYPVVYASAREAAQICGATGKRICDAHEWEGACAGALHTPDEEYAWGKVRTQATAAHNKAREMKWAYGPAKNHALCATGAWKTPSCPGGGWNDCGSNTYPAGAFPACVSPFGVYDQHGNAAEHMNLPLDPSELASHGGSGSTEMKGSWFVFSHQDAHEDDCRWRAKDWHPSRLMSEESHYNYHLGFRCCADVPTPTVASADHPAGAT